MTTLRMTTLSALPVLAAIVLLVPHDGIVRAQVAARTCGPVQVIPLTGKEPPARLVIESPLPEPLASRGVTVIPYCATNMRMASVFGAGALAVSPRVGHVHVTVDQAPWHWADASGNPLIIGALPPGPHEVLIELVDANHQVVDKGTIKFVVPRAASEHAAH